MTITLEYGQNIGYPPEMRSIPLSEAKDRLSALVEEVEASEEMVQITKHGRAAAVLMSVGEFEALEDTVFWLSQPGIHEDIAEARRARAAGETISGEELAAELGIELP